MRHRTPKSTLFPYTTLFRSNEQALALLSTEKRLEIVPGASHLFEEPGTLTEVARLAGAWFERYLSISSAHSRPARRATSDRKSTRLNSSHQIISYAVFCLKK